MGVLLEEPEQLFSPPLQTLFHRLGMHAEHGGDFRRGVALCERKDQGQAAIELEMISDETKREGYEFKIGEEKNIYVIDPVPVIEFIIEDLKNGVSQSNISSRFHIGLADLIVKVSKILREETGISKVCLSGGVFQNMILRSTATERLKRNKFKVYNHKNLPPNDGGISAGQVAIGMKNR